MKFHPIVFSFILSSPLHAAWSPDRAASVCLGPLSFAEASPVFPRGLTIDSSAGKVYVLDDSGSRVLRYNLASATANGGTPEAVLGQPDLSGTTPAGGPARIKTPSDVAVYNGSLWVSDYGNNRVLRFDNAATKPTGSPADAVLGQQDLNGSALGHGRSEMSHPWGLAVDAAGRLFVADTSNHRVLRFDNAQTLPSGAQASAVFGQTGFTQFASGNSASGLTAPTALTVGNGNGGSTVLWVADSGNYRVVRYDSAHTVSTGPSASGLLGQNGFGKNVSPPSTNVSTFKPASLALDGSGRLYIGDSNGHRVLRYDAATAGSTTSALNGTPADASAVLGQPNFSTGTPPDASLAPDNYEPAGLCISGSQLWISDSAHRRAGCITAPLSGDDFQYSVGVVPFPGSNQFTSASSVAVDPVTGKVFVGDEVTSQIFRFASCATLTSGQPAEARQITTYPPRSLTFNSTGTLFGIFGHSVWINQDPSNSLGTFTKLVGTPQTAGCNTDLFNNPASVCAWDDTWFWVADSGNNRVIRYKRQENGTVIHSLVTGQTDFVSSSPGSGYQKLNNPRGVAIGANDLLYIADTGNHRLAYRILASLQTFNGLAVSGAFGQSEPDDVPSSGTTDSKLNAPTGVAVDRLGRAWVADTGNKRVLRFEFPAPAPAKAVLGQKDYVSSISGASLRQLNAPASVAIDPQGCVWVADTGNQRVLRHKPNDPVMLDVSRGPYGITFKCLKEPAVSYQIQRSTDLLNWVFVQEPADYLEEITYTQQISVSARFYRVAGP
jgi:sugar lactone lactonase YvrE